MHTCGCRGSVLVEQLRRRDGVPAFAGIDGCGERGEHGEHFTLTVTNGERLDLDRVAEGDFAVGEDAGVDAEVGMTVGAQQGGG